MPARIDRLLEQIEQTLTECDARRLPPLTSGPAAAALDFVQRLPGVELTPWQESIVRAVYAEPDPVRQLATPPARRTPFLSLRAWVGRVWWWSR